MRYTDRQREARTAWQNRRRRAIAYGQWGERFVTPEKARTHITELRRMGMSVEAIADASGTSAELLARIIYPNSVGYRRWIRPETEAAVLAARFDLDTMQARRFLPSVGTRRRIQALSRVGWPQQYLADRLGITLAAVNAWTTQGQVTVANARKVRDLYDELSMRPGPAVKATRRAELKGWPPPLAWDDDTIDDPDAMPDMGEPTRVATGGPGIPHHVVIENVSDLLEFDASTTTQAAADRIGLNPSTLKRVLERAGRQDLRDRLTRNAMEAA